MVAVHQTNTIIMSVYLKLMVIGCRIDMRKDFIKNGSSKNTWNNGKLIIAKQVQG